jgi:hypothetical protein
MKLLCIITEMCFDVIYVIGSITDAVKQQMVFIFGFAIMFAPAILIRIHVNFSTPNGLLT